LNIFNQLANQKM